MFSTIHVHSEHPVRVSGRGHSLTDDTTRTVNSCEETITQEIGSDSIHADIIGRCVLLNLEGNWIEGAVEAVATQYENGPSRAD